MASWDWATISALATGAGTLVLAIATFASVRSANRAARAAERSLLAGLRPVLVPSRLQDPPEKIMFIGPHWVRVEGGGAVAECTDDVIYLAIALRNVGNGLAVLDRWHFRPAIAVGATDHADPADFRRLTRDLYVPAGDVGFWQGGLRDPNDPLFAATEEAIRSRQPMSLELLYADHEGGQRAISRFAMVPREDGKWLATISRHWNLDRSDPR